MNTPVRRPSVLPFAIACLLAATVPSAAQTASRIRIGIVDLSPADGPSARGQMDAVHGMSDDPGRNVAKLLAVAFSRSGRFGVVKRERLYRLLNDKRIGSGAEMLGERAETIGFQLGWLQSSWACIGRVRTDMVSRLASCPPLTARSW